MSQFDVHRNPGRNAAAIPFVVVVQSASFDRLDRRIVVPLVLEDFFDRRARLVHAAAIPSFTVEGIKVVFNPFDMVSVEAKKLGLVASNLAAEGDTIIKALDEVFSRALG